MAGYLPESIPPTTIVAMSSSAGINADAAPDRTVLPRYRPLLIVLLAASVGIAADSYLPQSFMTWLTAVLLTLGIWYLLARRGYHRAAAGLIFLAILSVAGAWHHCQWNLFDENDLGNYTGGKKTARRPGGNCLDRAPAVAFFRA